MNRRIFTIAASSFVVLCISTNSVLGAEPKIHFPKNYKKVFENYLSLDRTQHANQTIRLFASPTTMRSANKDAPLPSGTVLVAEVYKAKKNAAGKVVKSGLGRRIRGPLAAIAVMEKRDGWGKEVPATLRNGDWDFAIFSPTGKRLVGKDLDSCRSCHAPLSASDHVFSLEHIKR